MIASSPIGIQEGSILVDLIFQVDSKNEFDEGEAKKNSAVVSSKRNKRFNVKNFPSFSKLRFFGNGVGVPFAEVYKPPHVSRPREREKASSESKSW